MNQKPKHLIQKSLKRILCYLLVFVLAFGIYPGTGLQAEAEEETESSEQNAEEMLADESAGDEQATQPVEARMAQLKLQFLLNSGEADAAPGETE